MISCEISFDVRTYELISKRIENGIDEHEVYSVQMQKKGYERKFHNFDSTCIMFYCTTLPHRLLQYYGKKFRKN